MIKRSEHFTKILAEEHMTIKQIVHHYIWPQWKSPGNREEIFMNNVCFNK